MTIQTPEWVKDAIFYQIFPDRFAASRQVKKSGLKLEAWDSPPTPHGFKGGDLLGIVEHLDYLQELGINAIYLNPIFSSAANHRYHTYDYHHVDPLLGGDSALRELLDAAHARDIRILPDGVFNHASRGFWPFHHVLECGDGSPYSDWFHFNLDRLTRRKHWGAYPTQAEQRQLDAGRSSLEALGYQAWWNLPALPKFNTGTPAVREFLWGVAEHWIKFGVDGWRLDVPAEIDDDSFWQEFRRRVKQANPEAYIVGEIWHESQRWLRGDQFDAVMNYLLTGALLGFLLKDSLDEEMQRVGDYWRYLKPLDGPAFADRIEYILNLYDDQVNQVQLNLLDSHDTPRFLTSAHGDRSSLRLGWLFLFTFPGAPCIYYGDEVGLLGGKDPDCRRTFPWREEDWDHDLHAYAKSLIALRKAHPALRRGSFKRLLAEDMLIAYVRQAGAEHLLVVINAADRPASLQTLASRLGTEAAAYQPLLGMPADPTAPAQFTRQALGSISLPARSGAVLQRRTT